MKTVVLILVYGFQIYLLIGVLVALFVQFKGLKKVDSSVEGAGVWFRIITFPGIVGLWPAILRKWFRASGNNAET